jgi:hypothetical protein
MSDLEEMWSQFSPQLKGGFKMDGKELFRLLDLVKDLRKEADDFKKAAVDADDNSLKKECKLKTKIYTEIAEKLENLLRELNS